MVKRLLLAFLLVICSSYAIDTRPPDIDGPGGIAGGGGGGSGLVVDIVPQTSVLSFYLEVDCFDMTRSAFDGLDPRNVVFSRKLYHDGADSIYPYQETYPVAFTPASGWPEAGGPSFNLTINLTNIYFIRFEGRDMSDGGGCYAYGRQIHDEYIAGVYQTSHDSSWVRLPLSDFYYSVNWDRNRDQCELLGGDWLDLDNGPPCTGNITEIEACELAKTLEPDSGYDGYRCCGDDWIWINNKPTNYDDLSSIQRQNREDDNDLCLYSNTPDYGLGIDGLDLGLGDRSYFCDKNTDHVPYDDVLDYDNPEDSRANSTRDFFFAGYGDFETDLGKWSDYNDSNPMFCDISFSNTPGGGIQFEWKTIADAAQEQSTCEIMLGHGWTGAGCCGAPGQPDFYNDPAVECDGDQIYNWIRTLHDESFLTHIAFKQEFDRLCNQYMGDAGYTQNKACYNATPVSNNTVLYQGDEGSVFNENGILYVCEGGQNLGGFDVSPKCSYKGDFAMCTYANNTWYMTEGSPDDYSYVVLGYRNHLYDTRDELAASLHDSSLPTEVNNIINAPRPNECCFADACWEGSICVDENMKYQFFNDNWEEYDSTADDNKDVYMCQDGAWIGPLDMQYDWFYDTDHPDYCVAPDQCVCTVDNCGDYLDNGCTNVADYFNGEYICEERVWTSRSKLLVTQLRDIASSDYTLFCDDFERTLNYGDPMSSAAASINQICVLNYTGGVVLGFSLNSGTDDPFGTNLDDVLFNQNDGVVSVVLGENILNCDYAIDNADNSEYGLFRRCDMNNNKVFYNNKTQLLIYINDGNSADVLPWNYNTHNSFVTGQFDQLSAHINANEAAIDAHPDILNIQVFQNANKYSRVYMSETGSESVFGVLETLYDPDRLGNRNYLGVHYQNIDNIDCDTITEANRHAYCGQSGANVFVIERRNDLTFPLWSDLTAELRFRN